MKLTPIDITQQKFSKSFSGYNKHAVSAFLELVASELSEAVREKHSLEDENEELKAQLEEFRERERALKETMLAAQRVTEDMKATAQREAEVIVARAELAAERLLEEAQKRQTTLLSSISDLKRRKVQMVAEFRGLLHTYERLLEAESKGEEVRPKILNEEAALDLIDQLAAAF